EAWRRLLRAYFAGWRLKQVYEDALRGVAEDVSGRDLKWLFGEWLHATPLFDYRLKRVERHHLVDGRWRTVVTIERRGEGRLPVEIGDADTIYARATGEPAEERVAFVTAARPGRLVLDPRGRTHDYNLLNNREARALVGRGAWTFRLDDPTREAARRDRLVRAWLPVAWSNTFGGFTVGLRERSNYLGSYDRGLLLAALATGRGATNRFSFYGRWSNPIGHPEPRSQTSVSASAAEGRAGGSSRPRVTTSRVSGDSPERPVYGPRSWPGPRWDCGCSPAATPGRRRRCGSGVFPSRGRILTRPSATRCCGVGAPCSCGRT